MDRKSHRHDQHKLPTHPSKQHSRSKEPGSEDLPSRDGLLGLLHVLFLQVLLLDCKLGLAEADNLALKTYGFRVCGWFW
jgi:hypothetical protein